MIHEGEDPVRMEAETGLLWTQTREMQGLWAAARSWERSMEQVLSRTLRRMQTCNTLTLDFRLQNCERIDVCYFLSHQICSNLLPMSQETSILSNLIKSQYLSLKIPSFIMSFSSPPHSLTPETTSFLFAAHKLNGRSWLQPDRVHNSWLTLPVPALSAFDPPVREIRVLSVLEKLCPIIGKWVSKLGSTNLMKYYIVPEYDNDKD